jgi:ElaB/YqjD/DUF883 family membrane-anchored ribosome-binding protein
MAADIQKVIEVILRFRDETGKKVKLSQKQIQNALKKTRDSSDALQKNIQKNTLKMIRTLRMAGLSLMVFGFATARILQSIATSATSSFQEIINSNGYLNTNLNRLVLMWEFLKFTIGSAINESLGPYIDKIQEVVEKVQNWIEENPELFSSLLMIGIALGLMAGFLGLIIYFVTGIEAVFTGAFGSKVLGLIGGVSLAIWGVIAAIIILTLFIPEARAAFMEMFKSAGGAAKNFALMFKDLLSGDVEGALEHFNLAFLYVIKTIMDAWIWMAEVITGAFKIFMNSMNALFLGAAKMSDKLKITKGAEAWAKEKIDERNKEFDEENSKASFLQNWSDKLGEKISKLESEMKPVTEGTATETSETSPANSAAASSVMGMDWQNDGSGQNITITYDFSGVSKDMADQMKVITDKMMQDIVSNYKSYKY